MLSKYQGKLLKLPVRMLLKGTPIMGKIFEKWLAGRDRQIKTIIEKAVNQIIRSESRPTVLSPLYEKNALTKNIGKNIQIT